MERHSPPFACLSAGVGFHAAIVHHRHTVRWLEPIAFSLHASSPHSSTSFAMILLTSYMVTSKFVIARRPPYLMAATLYASAASSCVPTCQGCDIRTSSAINRDQRTLILFKHWKKKLYPEVAWIFNQIIFVSSNILF